MSIIAKPSAIAAALLLSAALSAPVQAASKAVDVVALRKLVTGLGLEINGDSDAFVQIENQGSRNYSVTMQPTDEGQSVLIYTRLNDVAVDKLNTVPLAQMLEYNDTHASYFTISTVDAGKAIYLQYHLAAPTVTPQALRTSIDSLLNSADETSELWDEKNWTAKTAAIMTPPAYGANNAMFVTEPTTLYGAYHRRPNNVFAPGEKLLSYFEPVGFGYKPAADGTYQFGTNLDLEIRGKDGAVLANQKDFLKQSVVSHAKVAELYDDVSLTASGLPAGDYVVVYTLHDITNDKTARVEQPFTIKAKAAQ